MIFLNWIVPKAFRSPKCWVKNVRMALRAKWVIGVPLLFRKWEIVIKINLYGYMLLDEVWIVGLKISHLVGPYDLIIMKTAVAGKTRIFTKIRKWVWNFSFFSWLFSRNLPKYMIFYLLWMHMFPQSKIKKKSTIFGRYFSSKLKICCCNFCKKVVFS